MSGTFSIGARSVGSGAPCFVIAEIGSNHNQQLALAQQMIARAAKAGADAVKFQSIQLDRLYVPASVDEARRQLFSQIELQEDWHAVLQRTAADEGVVFLSSPTYVEAVDLLDALDVAAIKIASPQAATDPFVLERAARTGRPLIVSTGYLELPQIDRAVSVCESAGATAIALLHCVAEYPTSIGELNLRGLPELAKRYGHPAGLSDHTMTSLAPVMAVAMGAALIEKHVTFDRTAPGPDHAFALEFDEFRSMVEEIREAESALGATARTPTVGERERVAALRQCAVAAADLPAGTVLSRASIAGRRGVIEGIDLWDADRAYGRTLRRSIDAGTPIVWSDLQ